MIKIGDKIKDNDPRMGNRFLTIIGTDVSTRRVEARVNYSGRSVWIKESRIHTDGKPRRSGFDLVVK
jgi:hypothetical protein